MLTAKEKDFIRKGCKTVFTNLAKIYPKSSFSEKLDMVVKGFFVSEEEQDYLLNRPVTEAEKEEVCELIKLYLAD